MPCVPDLSIVFVVFFLVWFVRERWDGCHILWDNNNATIHHFPPTLRESGPSPPPPPTDAPKVQCRLHVRVAFWSIWSVTVGPHTRMILPFRARSWRACATGLPSKLYTVCVCVWGGGSKRREEAAARRLLLTLPTDLHLQQNTADSPPWVLLSVHFSTKDALSFVHTHTTTMQCGVH